MAGVTPLLLAACTGTDPVATIVTPPASTALTNVPVHTPEPTPVVEEPRELPPPTAMSTPIVAEKRIYVVGDSLTSGAGEIMEIGHYLDVCWVGYLSPNVEVVGSWAVTGATTADMLQGVEPSDADLVVIMAGENDKDTGVEFPEIARNLDAIVDKVGAPEVLIVGATPTEYDPDTAKILNAELQQYAVANGFHYVDGGLDVRDLNGDWLPGMTLDGTHPSSTGARLIARTLEPAILAA